MFTRNKNRLRRARVGFPAVIAVSVGTTLLSVALLRATGVRVDTSLGIAGILFGVCTLVMVDLRQRESPRKAIVFIGLDDDFFSANLVQGLRTELDDAFPHSLTILTPSKSDRDNLVDWQAEQLGVPTVLQADAVVIAPSRDNRKIWTNLIHLSRKGIFILVIDIEPPHAFFGEQAAVVPAFVASDFSVGGQAVGGLIADVLQADCEATGLICIGPDWSSAAATRSCWLLYQVARADIMTRISIHEITSWEPLAVVDRIYDRIQDLSNNGQRTVVCFCADDRIMFQLDQRILRQGGVLNDRVRLIGYDGSVDNAGQFIAAGCPHAIATLNARPQAQGRAAARLLRDAYESEKVPGSLRQLVEPEVVPESTWRI